MVCLEVFVNGNKVCTAGVGDYGCIAAAVTWWNQHPVDIEEPIRENLCLRIDGHIDHGIRNKPRPEELVHWSLPEIAIGDEVSIRIRDTDRIDPPDMRGFEDFWAGLSWESKRRQYRNTKKWFEKMKQEMEAAGED